METELSASHIPEVGDEDFSSCTRYMDTLSSWLGMDNHCNSTLPDELLDWHMLDGNMFQFGTSSDLGVNTTSDHHRPKSQNAYLLDLSDSQPNLDTVSMLLDTTTVETHDHDNYTDLLLPKYNMFPPATTEGHNNSLATPVVIGSTIGSTTTSSTTTTTSPEMYFNQLSPSANVTINISSPALWENEVDDRIHQSNKMSTTMTCRNLVSERNRRNRLSQQLLALRAVVPTISKMDKRSILVDALAYLKSILEETASIQAELKGGARNKAEASLPPHAGPGNVAQGRSIPKSKAEILKIETEKMDDCRFIAKMTCRGKPGVGGEALHAIESLGLTITYIALEQTKPQHYLTTVFIRVRGQGKMTEEKLKDCITSAALRSGLSVKNP